MTGQEGLRRAFESVRREDFLPKEQRGAAREDRAIHIGQGQTNSQPSTVANMLGLLDVEPGHRVLDVGCGSGWTSALLGVLVGPSGQVHGVELVPELVTWGQQNLGGYPMDWVDIAQASSETLGLPDQGPFDRILVSAEAPSVPDELVKQLGGGGLMVVPVAGRLAVVRRTEEGVDVVRHGHYAFVPLIEP